MDGKTWVKAGLKGNFVHKFLPSAGIYGMIMPIARKERPKQAAVAGKKNQYPPLIRGRSQSNHFQYVIFFVKTPTVSENKKEEEAI